MYRCDDARRPGVVVNRLAAMLRDAEGVAHDGLAGGGAEHHNHVGLDHLDLGLEPGLARGDLTRAGLGMNAALSARLELEMFDGVGDVNFRAIDADSIKRLIEHAAGGADERFARAVFLIAGLLADEDD